MNRTSPARHVLVRLVAILVAGHGLFIVASILLEQLALHRNERVYDVDVNVPLLIGMSLLYLAIVLRRRKYTAWLTAVAGYGFLLGANGLSFVTRTGLHHLPALGAVRSLVLPVIVIGLLIYLRDEYSVRSDFRGFRSAARFSLLVLIVAFLYGTTGFALLDTSDFHQEISWPAAAHYTVDQFDLTTNKPIVPYTRRAHLFVDSLSVISVAAVGYALLSFYQPLRLSLTDQTRKREQMTRMLTRYRGKSEDFFKLWPHDKQYFFNQAGTAGLAFQVYRGTAMVLGDPVGQGQGLRQVMAEFTGVCDGNDWQPAFVHITERRRTLYESQGLQLQKIGQEAVVDINQFMATTKRNKYFRHINNKFNKQGFTFEVLAPPHHDAVLARLKVISDDWLSRGGRAERGFAMGYFSPAYMQLCEIAVIRDAAGTIQAFLNQVPASFDPQEATYDLLRYTADSPGNSNDFLLMSFIEHLQQAGYQTLNLGLCPLVGLNESEDSSSLIGGALRFAYANGDRLYSFSGLYRFKAKYEPEWRDRFIAYKGGVRGFGRSMNALMRLMRVKASS